MNTPIKVERLFFALILKRQEKKENQNYEKTKWKMEDISLKVRPAVKCAEPCTLYITLNLHLPIFPHI